MPRRIAIVATLLLATACAGGRERGGSGYRPVSDDPIRIGAPYRVRGRSYVPVDDRRYDAVGAASWYGPESGSRTANGERFRPDGISAAHPTLPLPSYVEVTALATGRAILVRVNDRGPFAPGRIIDLSRGAARLLGSDRAGIVQVRVRRVFPGDADRATLRAGRPVAWRPAPPAARPVAPAAAWWISVARFDDPDWAAIAAEALDGRVAGDRVWMGPYRDPATAAAALAQAKSTGYQNAIVVPGTASIIPSVMDPAR